MNLDKITTSKPVNKTAALSVNQNGVHFESDRKIETVHSISPPDYSIWLPDKIANRKLKRLIGFKFGRLTVMGITKTMKKRKCAKYVCKCDCGIYTTRKHKSIKNPNNNKDSCDRCRETDHIRRKANYLAYGNWNNAKEKE